MLKYSMRHLSKTVAIGFYLSLLVHSQSSQALQGKSGPLIAQTKGQLKTGLEKAANDFLSLIEKGDPKQLVGHCSQQGVLFGVDAPPVSRAVIRENIDKKKGIFCGFFDTDCMRREDSAERARNGALPATEPLYSYRERLLKASGREVRVSLRADFPTSGSVFVALKNDVQAHRPLEFEFEYEKGEWRLSGISFW
jgi:hypothetical protein